MMVGTEEKLFDKNIWQICINIRGILGNKSRDLDVLGFREMMMVEEKIIFYLD